MSLLVRRTEPFSSPIYQASKDTLALRHAHTADFIGGSRLIDNQNGRRSGGSVGSPPSAWSRKPEHVRLLISRQANRGDVMRDRTLNHAAVEAPWSQSTDSQAACQSRRWHMIARGLGRTQQTRPQAGMRGRGTL